MPHRRIRQVSLAATITAALWTAYLVFVGGFDLPIGRYVFSSHEPLRPILWGSLTLAVFVWANGVDRTAGTWARALGRLPHGLVAAGLALSTFVIGVVYASTVATASDSYGYMSQADLWIDGTLKIAQPWAAQAPWPEPQWSFTPLGYRPSPNADEWSLVPIYSPGLPLLMAGAKLVGGQAAMFLSGTALRCRAGVRDIRDRPSARVERSRARGGMAGDGEPDLLVHACAADD